MADWLRSEKTTLGWQTFIDIIQADNPSLVTYCFNSLPNDLSSFENLDNANCPTNSFISNTNFQRQATFNLSEANNGLITVDLTTSWQDNTTHQVTTQIKLSQ